MTGLSLFSGIGGMDIAFEWAGGTVAAMCEIDPFCRKVLRKHWPDVPLFGDVKEARGSNVGAIDVVYGGFPCQPFSVAGNREGQGDDRYLWPEFSRLVGEIGPRWVVAENVPGIMSLAADDICQDLERLGYCVGIWRFEAAAVGAPHRRARVFFVAHSDRAGILRDGSVRGWTREAQQAVMGDKTPGHTESGRRDNRIDRSNVGTGSGEHCGRREPESGMGRVADGLPPRLDGGIWECEPEGVPRAVRGVPDRTKRLKALGNAVVLQQVYPIFRAIMEVEHGYSATNQKP